MLPEYGGKLYDLTYRKYPTYEELKIKKCFENPGPGYTNKFTAEGRVRFVFPVILLSLGVLDTKHK